MVKTLPGRQRVPNPTIASEAERGNPVPRPLRRASEPQGEPMGVRDWDVGRSECRPVMGRIRVSTLPGAKASPRPTGPSLQESLENHQQEGTQMKTMGYHWSVPPQPQGTMALGAYCKGCWHYGGSRWPTRCSQFLRHLACRLTDNIGVACTHADPATGLVKRPSKGLSRMSGN